MGVGFESESWKIHFFPFPSEILGEDMVLGGSPSHMVPGE